jgi:hypothetical protein
MICAFVLDAYVFARTIDANDERPSKSARRTGGESQIQTSCLGRIAGDSVGVEGLLRDGS